MAGAELEHASRGPQAETARVRPRLDLLRFAVMGMLACYVWRVQELFSVLMTTKASLVLSVLAIVAFAASPSALGSLLRRRNTLIRLSAFLLGWMILSVPTSLYPGLSLSFIIDDHIKTFWMMLLVLATVRSFVDVERYAMVQVLGGAIYCYVVFTRFPPGPNMRLNGLIYYDANDLAMMLTVTLPLTVYFMRRGVPMVIRSIAVVSAWGYLAAIVKSGSRGGLLGLIAVSAYMVLTFSALPTRVRIGSLIGALLIVSAFGSDKYWTQMGTILNPQDDYNWSGNAEMGRMEVWKRGLKYMVDRPIIGVGVAAFPIAEGTISPLAARQEFGYGTKWSVAHNSFLQVGAELGVPGLIAFVALLVVAFRSLGGIRRQRLDDLPSRRAQAAMAQALSASLIGYAVSGFFLSQGYAAVLYSILGLIVALDAVNREQSGDLALEPAGG